MATLEHSRYKVFSLVQHMLRHTLSEFMYSNSSAPGVQNAEDALNYIFKVLYPQTKPSVDWETDQGDGSSFLPTTGNELGDYRNVLNGYTEDGGTTYKTAGFMWAMFDGETTPSWHMTTVFDWGTNDVASVMIDRTKLLYYFKLGMNDVDSNGDELVGDEKGQHLYGGIGDDANLVLNASNGNTAGHEGFIKFNDDAVPMDDNAFVLGQIAKRFKEFYSVMAVIGNVSIVGNTISTADAVKIIDFVDNEIRTTGQITAGKAVVDNITIDDAKITSDTGTIDFDDEDLTSTGTATIGAIETQSLIVDTTMIDNGVLTDTDNVFDMDVTDVNFQNRVKAQEFKATDGTDSITVSKDNITSSGDLTLTAVGIIKLLKDATVQAITGLVATFTKLVVDHIIIDDKSIVSDDTLLLDATEIITGARIVPDDDGVADIGKTDFKYNDLHISGEFNNGSFTMGAAELMKLRDASTGLANVAGDIGKALFWTGLKWEPSEPDNEIDHGEIDGLGDDDHTQYVAKDGRTGGQSIHGGTANTEVLALSGYVGGKYYIVKDSAFAPNDDALADLGEAAKQFKDLYLKGQLIGARVENRTDATLTDASVDTKGRLVYSTDGKAVYVDNGGAYQRVGLNSYKGTHTATELTDGVNVSATIDDATNCLWQVVDIDEDNETIYPTITKTATTVTISTDVALPAHNFKLIGVEA